MKASRSGPLVASLAIAAAALAPPAHACDSSSCAMLTRGQSGLLRKGGWTVDMFFRYTDQGQPLLGSVDVPQAIRPRIDFAGQRLQPFYHVELEGSDSIVQADAAYGVTDRLAVTASIPLIGVRSYNHIHYPPPPDSTAPTDGEHGHGGTTPSGPSLLRLRTEGNGDALLGLRYALVASSRQRLQAAVALQVPIGRSRITVSATRPSAAWG
jgi:hypothetical protein